MIGAITGATRVYAVLGRPVRRSASPALHNAWFQRAGLDAVYVALEVPAGRDPDLAALIRDAGLAGANLTVPFKRRILGALSALGPEARAAGAVNTVVAGPDGLRGENTDAPGFVAAVTDAFGPLPDRALVIGAGGAGRAVVAGLRAAGVAHVEVISRSPAVFDDAGVVVSPPEALAHRLPGAGLVAHCTSDPAALAGAPLAGLSAAAICVDLNYWDPSPVLLAAARAVGARAQDGWPMLVHQAALAFAHFTGTTVPIEEIRAAVRAGHQARAGR